MSDMVPEVLNAALDSLFTPKEPGEQEYQAETRLFPAFADASRKRWRKRNARMNWWSGSVKSGS